VTGERLRRGSAWALASGVAVIAAIVSYSHIYDLGRAYGGSYLTARLLPLSVDMLILVGELMLLHEGDVKGRRFRPGWALVVSGIAATMAANVTFGAQFGVVGAVIWGWPAYSFILVAAGMVAMVRRAGAAAPSGPSGDVPALNLVAVPTDAQNAAEMALRATLAAGNPLSGRQLETRFGLSRSEATNVRQLVMAEANGHAPEPDPPDTP
jgi:Protein of unknown function (DUF2637)